MEHVGNKREMKQRKKTMEDDLSLLFGFSDSTLTSPLAGIPKTEQVSMILKNQHFLFYDLKLSNAVVDSKFLI